MEASMRNLFAVLLQSAACLAILVLSHPDARADEDLLGGITFSGDREGVCVLIEGDFIDESIYFKLDTCDENQTIKEQFKDKTPFTLLVPKGEHRLVIIKEGREVVTDTITINPEEILEYPLP
jgi:hypothetical protein